MSMWDQQEIFKPQKFILGIFLQLMSEISDCRKFTVYMSKYVICFALTEEI